MIRFSIFCVSGFLAMFFFSCKKQTVDEITLVKNKFLGKWPLKIRINIERKNNLITKNDTVALSTAEIFEFFANDSLYIGADKTTYSFDSKAENITFNTPTPTIWHIEFLRINSIVLSRNREEMIGEDKYTYYTEEHLVK